MLNKNSFGDEYKLKKAACFLHIYKHAEKFRYQGISVLACKNELNRSRIGVSISRKQIPHAVDRNRIKRIIREKFRVDKNELTAHLDLVFCVYAAALEYSNVEIRACVDFLWEKLISFYKKV